ncbi:alpha-L-fucosidase [Rubripirellula reticaptiva]|uniref:alpha-L-fucosidase n=1 Tax=Rubripirellula reticaptiva TaxID=2528013 RepID=A0A5C6EU84_9BACT|nr:alpha-L-fucosidase [Rubripirellula reticaptiva]TWU51850.1 Alpha-L-fucosidase [Rubripirellula reticaptiva]
MKRREFLDKAARGTGAAALAVSSVDLWGQESAVQSSAGDPGLTVPSYLTDVADLYQQDPRKAAIKWFQDAKFGLFIHYGLYSLLGRGEWVQIKEKIRVAEYEKLASRFTAEKFDADFITDMTLESGMKYINITTRHHDSFCLFDSKYTDFKSTNTPAKRDLVGELAEQCSAKGLGFYLYYSHGRDWRHPHAPNNWGWGGSARPKYDPPETFYTEGPEHDLQIYVEFMKNQVTELLTNYGPIGGIWLDGIGVPLSRRGKMGQFHTQELYDHIHSLQPQVLASYKQGLLGTEDFKAPERNWKGESNVPLELCDTLQPHGWGYTKSDDGKHKTPEQVMAMLDNAKQMKANLLLNTGPMPDGSIHPEDVKTLKQVGKNLAAGKKKVTDKS